MTFNFNNGNGITGVEFPIVYFVIAQFYKIFGFSDFIFRLFTLSISIFSFIYFIELLKLFNKNLWLILLGIIIIYTSPVFIYYSFSYIPDIYSINLFIIALYYFEKFRRTNSLKYLVLYFVIISLSVLIKITFAIYLIAILGTYLIIKNKKYITKEKLLLCLLTCLSVLACYTWYSYSKSLNVKYNSGVFLMDFKPSESIVKYFENMSRGFKTWFFDFINPVTLFVIVFIFFYLSRKLLNTNKFYTILLFISVAGVISFTYLFSYQYIHHDYYYIQFYTLLIILYIVFIDYIDHMKINLNHILKPLVIILTIFSIFNLKNNIRDRFDQNSIYNNYSTYMNTINLINIESDIKKLNLPDSTKFIVYDDPSMNISLYYMKRFGVQLSYLNDKGTIDWYMSKSDYDYVLINNNNLVNNQLINHWLGESIIITEHYSIYKKNK